MKTLRDIGLLGRRRFTVIWRSPGAVAVGIATPLLYLALFVPLLQKLAGGPGFPAGNALNVFLPGILAFWALGAGAGSGYSVIFELQGGITERLHATPVRRFALLAGPILANVAMLLVSVIILVAVAVPFGFALHIVGMLVAFVLMALLLTVFAAFSFSMALIIKDLIGYSAIVNGLNLPLLLLSGVLLPLTLAPQWMRVVAYLNPIYYVVEANRLLAAGSIVNSTVGVAFLVMILLAGVTIWWATRVHRRALE